MDVANSAADVVWKDSGEAALGVASKPKVKAKEQKTAQKADVKEIEVSLDEDDVGESGRLYVCNIPYTTTEEELKHFFEKYGSVAEVKQGLCLLPTFTVVRYIFPWTK